jgi:GT2 family glycosyltransferase
MEDVDLRQRLVVAGYPFEFVPEAVVDHPPRRLASGRKLAQQHESWVYYWYKHGNRGVTLPRMLFDITRRRLIRIGQNGLNKNALLAIGSLTNELGATLVRAPLWEWTYRRRFRSIPKR